MDAIKEFFTFFIDNTHRASKRLSVAIIVLVALLIMDNHLNFSYNLKKDNQIEQIQKLEEVISSTEDSILVSNLKKMEREIMERQTIADYLSSSLASLWISATYSINKKSTSNKTNNPISYNSFWHFVSINWLLILFGLILLFAPFFEGKYDVQTFGSIILGEVFIITIMIILSFLANLFQPLTSNNTVNYLINALITAVIVIGPAAWTSLRGSK